jgi:predicted dinucleotide-binding enzyme
MTASDRRKGLEMRLSVLGTGTVGRTLAGALVEAGHEVTMGSRTAGNEKADEWASGAGDRAHAGDFAAAAAFGEIVVNATAGAASLDALGAAGGANLAGKVLVDVANPLDFSAGMPPTLSVCNTDSLAERIQREFPDARVVKALNTMSAQVMVDPPAAGGPSTAFICGDDGEAKRSVALLLEQLGWAPNDVMDLGDITAARGMEMYLPLWLRLFGAIGTPRLNVRVVRGEA